MRAFSDYRPVRSSFKSKMRGKTWSNHANAFATRRSPLRFATTFSSAVGSYHQALARLLEAAGYDELRREQARARAAGAAVGIGLACFIELTGPGAQFYGMGGARISGQEGATVRLEPSGAVAVLTGVPGVDAVYVGPADLSLALGCKPRLDQTDAPVVEAQVRIVEACKRHGVVAGIHNATAAYALKMMAVGYQFVTLASDTRFLAAKAAEEVGVVRKTVATGKLPAY